MNGKNILMHKNKKVATCYFDKDGFLKQIYEIHNLEHFPVMAQKNQLQGLQQWIASRSPQKDRPDYAKLKAFYGADKIRTTNGASLFDAYWFKNEDEHTAWDEINFFDNFTNDTDGVETLLYRQGKMSRYSLNVNSPNLTIPGAKERYWIKNKNGLFLAHKNAKEEMDEYKKVKDLGLPVLPREYFQFNDVLVTVIPSNTSAEIERISLEEYYIAADKSKNHSKVQNLIDCCEQFKLPNYRRFFSMIADYDDAIGLEERELTDIGVLRNTETLEIMGFHKL